MEIGTPGSKVASAAFGNEGMDMGIPFQIPAKSMKDTDKAWGKVFRFVELKKHPQDDIPDRMEQAVKEGVVLKKKDTEFLRDGKDTMSVGTGDHLAGHTESAFLVVQVSAGGAEAALTGKRDKFKMTTVRAAKKSAAKRRVMATEHAADIVHHILARTQNVLDIFKKIRKDSLEDVIIMHKNILQQKGKKKNPLKPLMNEGQGS